jgi:hypothetical protein
VRTTEEAPADLNTVSYHLAFAVLANRSDSLDCAFKAVKCVSRAGCNQIETLVIVVATNFAFCHNETPEDWFLLTEAVGHQKL